MANANTIISSLVIAALKAADTFGDRIDALRAALPADTLGDRTLCADALRPGVAKRHGIVLTRKETGRLVFPADHASSEAARQDLSRLVRSVMGAGANKASEEIDIPEELLAAARKLAKLANEYEGSRKLASKALAAAFAK